MSLSTQTDALADRVGQEMKVHDARLTVIEAALVSLGAIDLTTIEDFLNAREYFQSPGVETTTSTVFTDKLNVTTKALPAGDYRIVVSYGWNSDITTQDFRSRITINNSTLHETQDLQRQEPKDVAGSTAAQASAGTTGTASNQQFRTCAEFFVTLPAGAHDIVLQYATSSSGDEASMWDATISIEKFNFS